MRELPHPPPQLPQPDARTHLPLANSTTPP